ncbi:MAG: Fur family transcriptional regulator [Betaproteobacteria bacterium]
MKCGDDDDVKDVARQSIADELRGVGIRPTPQRVAIYEMLKGTTSHPSVEAVYETLKHTFPTMSLNTVYCTLQALVAAGLVRKLAMRENVFRYDANASPHAHFVCTMCGRVEDTPRGVDEDLAEIEPRLEARIPRLIIDHDHYFYGYCKDCEAHLGQPHAAGPRPRLGREERPEDPTKGES